MATVPKRKYTRKKKEIEKVVRQSNFSVAYDLGFKSWIRAQSQKEKTLFKNSRHPISFKPFFVYQGLAVLALMLVLAVFLIPEKKFNNNFAVKHQTIKQLSANIVGQPTQYTVLVKKSDITKKKISGQTSNQCSKGKNFYNFSHTSQSYFC